MSGYDDGWRSHDERVAKVQEAFEKARNGKGLFGIDIRKEAAESIRSYFTPLAWLWRLMRRNATK